MIEYGLLSVIIVVTLAWIYDYYNGANDCANAIATTVSTRVLTPMQAVFLAAVLNAAGAFFTTEVAKTIGKGLLPAEYMTQAVVLSAIIGAVVWGAFATHRGLPISLTHSIVGGVLGAGIASGAWAHLTWASLKKIVLGMVFSPLAGFIIAFLFLILLLWMVRKMHPRPANSLFGKLQLLSASFMAFSHGMNDTQNAMGIITASLLAAGYISTFEVPTWVILGSAFFMGLGTFIGGKKVIKTMGMRIAKIKTVQGFAAETVSAGVITGASFLGIPISTTHTISTAIMGVGSVQRVSAVRWGIVRHIIATWILTIPAAALVSGIISLLLISPSK
jgi:inorganic phosphate transporter, PiT family